MVLTDLPFERSPLIHSRYSLIQRPGSAPNLSKEDEEKTHTKAYAAFLREQDRKVGPEGFLDSGRYTHSYMLKKKNKGRSSFDGSRPSVVSLSSRIERDKKEYNKKVKVIEDHMWQHKQEERELKRVEGDIIKNQRAVRHTLRDFENALNKKRLAEEKKLNQGLQKYTKLRQEHTHWKEDLMKSRIEKNQLKEQENKREERKRALQMGDLSRQYRAKKTEIELKRVEVERMNQEYEAKMRSKEEEQHKLQQELADLAITLNMESQKARQQKFDTTRDNKKDTGNKINDDLNAVRDVENKLMKSDGDTKAAELNKRKLSADLALTKSHLAIKQRDEQRHLTDTQFKLDDNSNIQRQLNEAAFHAEMDLKAKQIEQDLEAHNARRINLLHTTMKSKKEKEQEQQAVWEARFKKRFNDQRRREHEDSLKFFQKMVTKGEDYEQNLYNSVRNAEYTRQKQEQTVRRIKLNLSELKQKNAQKIKNEMAESFKQEQEMEQQLIREKAVLDKAHNERENCYYKLQQHRQLLRDDKHRLEEHDREHNRLIKVGLKSDAAVAEHAY